LLDRGLAALPGILAVAAVPDEWPRVQVALMAGLAADDDVLVSLLIPTEEVDVEVALSVSRDLPVRSVLGAAAVPFEPDGQNPAGFASVLPEVNTCGLVR
jgi:hypothetical protein